MCGRFVMLTREEVAEVVASVESGKPLAPLATVDLRPQAFPGSDILAFGIPEDRMSVGSFRWGFPVEWSKKPVFNTRIESALSGKGMWRALIEGGRCIVPAVSFFEPHASEMVRSARSGKKVKRAYEFSAPTRTPLLLAALCDGENCSIVTTEPNRWVSPVHNRMPLALRFEEVPAWLGGEVADIAPLADRCAVELLVEPDRAQVIVDEKDKGEPGQLTLF